MVIPTDTVYGIAALPSIPGAVAAVFAVKGRPEEKPLPVLGATVEQLGSIVVFDAAARRVAARYWPGPLTLVLPRAPGFVHELGGRAGDETSTIAVRIPDCSTALQLLHRSGPLAVTSANRSGEPPATTVEEAKSALDGIDVFVDAGRCAGVPSTVISLGPKRSVLRRGGIPPDEVLQMLTE